MINRNTDAKQRTF